MDQQNGPKQTVEPTWQFNPGETISPRSTPAPTEASQSEPAVATQSSIAPRAETSTAEPVQQATTEAASDPQPPVEQPAAAVPSAQPFAPSEQAPPPLPSQTSGGVTWTASEYVANDKSAAWHTALIGVGLAVALATWFVIKDIVTSFVIIIAAVVLSLYGRRHPNSLQYQLDDHGLSIGQKHFRFSDFRAFSIIPEGAFASIALMPSKRFAPMTTLYFDPEDADAILGILGNHLPHKKHKTDAIEAIMQRIHF